MGHGWTFYVGCASFLPPLGVPPATFIFEDSAEIASRRERTVQSLGTKVVVGRWVLLDPLATYYL